MTENIIDLVRQYSDNLQNGRTISTIYDALRDEVTELDHEMYTDEPGEDGIAGEAVDVILCALDMILSNMLVKNARNGLKNIENNG